MKDGKVKLVKVTTFILFTGILLIFAGSYLVSSLDHLSKTIVTLLGVIEELGKALTVAAIIALTVESFLTKERIRTVLDILGPYKQARDAGLSNVFDDRQTAFNEIILASIPEAQRRIDILGICVSIHKEVSEKGANDKRLVPGFEETLARLLSQGCAIRVLGLCRYPDDEQREEYKLGTGDIFQWRERDEETNTVDYLEGHRLRGYANQAIGKWIDILVRVAERMKDSSRDDRAAAVKRLEVKEYISLPTMSAYFIDGIAYITPYLFKRHCRNVPTFKIDGEITPLYREYFNHFESTFEDSLTSSAIDPQFRSMLINDPGETISDYRRTVHEIQERVRSKSETEFLEIDMPENRIRELAMKRIATYR